MKSPEKSRSPGKHNRSPTKPLGFEDGQDNVVEDVPVRKEKSTKLVPKKSQHSQNQAKPTTGILFYNKSNSESR